MAIKIERGIDIPKRSGRGRPPSEFTAAMDKMRVGDSIFMGIDVAPAWSRVGSFLRGKSRASKKFTTRTVDGGCRIWRIK